MIAGTPDVWPDRIIAFSTLLGVILTGINSIINSRKISAAKQKTDETYNMVNGRMTEYANAKYAEGHAAGIASERTRPVPVVVVQPSTDTPTPPTT